MVAAPRVRHQSEPMNSGLVSSPTYASMRLAPPSPGVNWSPIARALRAAGTHRHRDRAAVKITCTVLGKVGRQANDAGGALTARSVRRGRRSARGRLATRNAGYV